MRGISTRTHPQARRRSRSPRVSCLHLHWWLLVVLLLLWWLWGVWLLWVLLLRVAGRVRELLHVTLTTCARVRRCSGSPSIADTGTGTPTSLMGRYE